jgi:hypothetical protein
VVRRRPAEERNRHGCDRTADHPRERDARAALAEPGSARRRIGDALAGRRVKQLGSPGFAPSARPPASEGLVSDVGFIITGAERNEILVQAVGK